MNTGKSQCHFVDGFHAGFIVVLRAYRVTVEPVHIVAVEMPPPRMSGWPMTGQWQALAYLNGINEYIRLAGAGNLSGWYCNHTTIGFPLADVRPEKMWLRQLLRHSRKITRSLGFCVFSNVALMPVKIVDGKDIGLKWDSVIISTLLAKTPLLESFSQKNTTALRQSERKSVNMRE